MQNEYFSDVNMDCRHGEAEIRMQYTVVAALGKLSDEETAITSVMQISKGSESVFFSMLGVMSETLERARNVFVRFSNKH